MSHADAPISRGSCLSTELALRAEVECLGSSINVQQQTHFMIHKILEK